MVLSKTGKFLIFMLISQVLFAQTKSLPLKSKKLGIYAGIGSTNLLENNTTVHWVKFPDLTLNFISKPSYEFGINYTSNLSSNFLKLNSELAFTSGGNQQVAYNQLGFKQLTYDNNFQSINFRPSLEFRKEIKQRGSYFTIGYGPSLNFLVSNSETNQKIDFGPNANLLLGQFNYTNKFNVGIIAFVGIHVKNSIIKLKYNYMKLKSDTDQIPFAPFYTLGLCYEHKIF